MIVVNSAVSAWLAVAMEEKPLSVASRITAVLPPLLFAGWALVKSDILPFSAHSIFFNLPVVAVLVAGLFLSPRHGTVRAYLILSVGSYLFEYIA